MDRDRRIMITQFFSNFYKCGPFNCVNYMQCTKMKMHCDGSYKEPVLAINKVSQGSGLETCIYMYL